MWNLYSARYVLHTLVMGKVGQVFDFSLRQSKYVRTISYVVVWEFHCGKITKFAQPEVR